MDRTNNPAPITDAELAELKRLHTAVLPGKWKSGLLKGGRLQVHASGEQICIVWDRTAYPATKTGEYIAVIHNAFPGLVARLEAAEENARELQDVPA